MVILCNDNCQYGIEEQKEVPVWNTGTFPVLHTCQTSPWNRELETMRKLEVDNNTCFLCNRLFISAFSSFPVNSIGSHVSTSAYKLGGPGFLSRPKNSYLYGDFSLFISFPAGKCHDSTLKVGHDRFLQNPFHFVIHFSPFHSTLHNLSY
jgi:hypothetical protein